MRERQCRAAAAFELGKHILSFGPQTKSLVARDTHKLNHGGCRNSASFGDDRLDQRLTALLARQHRDQRRSINDHRANPSSSQTSASISAMVGYVRLGTRAWFVLIPARNASRSFSFRSEEHKSELQSLIHNSYAVFCFKKKTGLT